MFCSNCGKTLKPGENQCPHCGMPVSESPFSSMSYTAAPPPENARPERPARQSEDGYAPVTRTTYTQMDEREQGDVYSRTTYRAPLSEEENAPQEPGPAANQPGQGESAPMDGESTGQDLSSAVPLDKVYESIPDLEEGEETAEIPPLPPVNRPGISEEVRRYMEEAEQERRHAASRPAKKRFSLFGLMGSDSRQQEEEAPMDADLSEAGTQSEPQAQEAAGESQETQAGKAEPAAAKTAAQKIKAIGKKTSGKKAAAGKVPVKKIVGMVVALGVILVVLIQGVRYLKYVTTPRAKVPTVSMELYDKGMELIQSHVTDEYRAEIVQLYQQDTSGAAATARQQQELDEIQALLNEDQSQRLEDDALFVKALMAIQQNINNACTYDFLAASNASDTQLEDLKTQADDQWSEVQNLLKRLENATETRDLENLNTGANEILTATPEPTPEPEVEYTTLKRGQKNSTEVKRLQNRLYELGYFNDVRDGDFGSKTEQAVKRFQKTVGLEADGVATPELQQLLFADDAPVRNTASPNPSASATPEASAAPEADGASASATPAPSATPASTEAA